MEFIRIYALFLFLRGVQICFTTLALSYMLFKEEYLLGGVLFFVGMTLSIYIHNIPKKPEALPILLAIALQVTFGVSLLSLYFHFMHEHGSVLLSAYSTTLFILLSIFYIIRRK